MAAEPAPQGNRIIKKTLDYYVVVDAAGSPCGHLHTDYPDAMSCPQRTHSDSVVRVQPTAPTGSRETQPTPTAERRPGPIHSTAIVADSARIGENVRIGSYAIVEAGVVVGNDSVLREHCVLREGTVIGRQAIVDSFAVIGGDPQDCSFDSKTGSGVLIGDRVTLREGVTVHRSTRPGGITRIGDDVILMANSHVGHDGRIEHHAVLANNAMLGGHVEVGAHAFLGGGVGVHQFVRIGESAMIGGNASISYDIPPFMLALERNRIRGLNAVGLRRREFSTPVIADLKRCYRAVYGTPGDVRCKASQALAEGVAQTDPGRRMLEFFATGARGFARPTGRG